ncbi:MAG: hypothetical protein JWM54_1155 [Acidobacteriaceae bacterium]|nr:hypothetical protein [Acidobacteriaceae bacterium]
MNEPLSSDELDSKGRHCGRKPIHYKGGSFASPLNAPLLFCDRCSREFDVVTGKQRENWAFSKCKGCGGWIKGGQKLCGECACEEDGL